MFRIPLDVIQEIHRAEPGTVDHETGLDFGGRRTPGTQ